MVAVVNILEDDFKTKFWISEVLRNFEWWQKKVFVVKIKEKIQIVKIFKNYSKRDIRELEIYEKYKNNNFLPKIIKITEYKGDTIVFEELIEWQTLEECKHEYKWNQKKLIELVKDIIDVLEELWGDEIVHRDIKPSNIIISNGKPYVIDFWIAKNMNLSSITEAWFQPWTRSFMSPEQLLWKNKLISYRSDFFSIGVLTYYLYYWNYPFWTDIESISQMFTSWNIDYNIDEDCPLTIFLKWILHIKPHLRPRNTNILLKLLP